MFFHLIDGNAPARLSLPPAVNVSKGPLVAGPVSGTWTVTAGSQAGYRVEEILLGQHHTAVGRTSKVSGGMMISGTTVTAADFTVDLASVRSDQPSRDAQFTGYIMKTYDYPHASFRLTQPIQLGQVPAPGRDHHRRGRRPAQPAQCHPAVTFRLQAERVGGHIDINAEIPITFSNWHIPNPSFAVTEVGTDRSHRGIAAAGARTEVTEGRSTAHQAMALVTPPTDPAIGRVHVGRFCRGRRREILWLSYAVAPCTTMGLM